MRVLMAPLHLRQTFQRNQIAIQYTPNNASDAFPRTLGYTRVC